MPLTDQDARALTYIAKRLREETHGANRWDEAGIHAVVAKLIGRNLPATVEQITRHASDPDAKTPGAINRPFLPDAPKSETHRPPRKTEECPIHAGQWRESCSACAADRLAGDTTRPADPRRPDGSDALALARAQLASTRANLCSHGVRRTHCREAHPTETDQTETDAEESK